MGIYYRYYRIKVKRFFRKFKRKKPTLGGLLMGVHIVSTTLGRKGVEKL
jgi:hypothetical protein|tara:strand:+ start:113 stop:259 length:147 start_codon:yes stop_codon:yes gene_type:complete